MRVLIEEYREWEIYFNTDSSKFYTMSNEYDTDKESKSYNGSKNYIDDYIKKNNVFKPCKIIKPRSMFNNGSELTIIGIRKDGDFTVVDIRGEKSRLSRYNEKGYFLDTDENISIFKKMEEHELKEKAIRDTIKEMRDTLNVFDFESLREKYKTPS